jgi:hypothetical protein
LDSFGSKVLAMLDGRDGTIHLDPTRLAVQQRFDTCHEVTHSLLPWHRELLYLDGAEQLDPAVQDLIEREANYGAASLLFQQEKFNMLARSYPTGIASVLYLADLFGGSYHSAFRLYAESSLDCVAVLVLRRSPIIDPDDNKNLLFAIKQVFSSMAWQKVFDWPQQSLRILSGRDYPALLWSWDRLSHRGWQETCNLMPLSTHGGEVRDVRIELFSNTYNLFLLVSLSRA